MQRALGASGEGPTVTSATPERHITWATFDADFLQPGLPANIPIAGTPSVTLFVDEHADRIGLRTALSANITAPSSPLAQIQIAVIRRKDVFELEVAASSNVLYREFFAFLLSLSDRIQLDGLPPLAALRISLESWQSLLSSLTLLTDEQQLGLTGELWLLERLFLSKNKDALRAWVGPLAEAHDFRLADNEFEVKTTGGERRVHRINGLEQLVASPSRRLYVVSLQFAAAGAGIGRSLPEAVQAIRQLIGADDPDLAAFEASLLALQYRKSDETHYRMKRQLRSTPHLVPVDENCPRITRTMLGSVLGAMSTRISDVHYLIDLEGLGHADGSPEFLSVLPNVMTFT